MPKELFGRSEESKTIIEILDDARAGAGAVALVEGIIGTGKTSLLRWAEETARDRGMIVLSATASPAEQRFPLGVVHQLLGTLPETAHDWDRTFAAYGAPHGDGRTEPDYPLLAELCASVGRAARRTPILLTVDSVQHVDCPSLLWLGFLSRRLENLPVVLLATKRCGEPASDQHLLVEFMEGLRPDRHIHLSDLSPSAALDLATSLCGHGHGHEAVDALVAGTGGNPYLLTEQIRTGPTGRSAPLVAAGTGHIGGLPGLPGASGLPGPPGRSAPPGHHRFPTSPGYPRRPGASLADPGAARAGLAPGDPPDERLGLQAVKERILCMLRRIDPYGLEIARAASILCGPVDAALLADLCGVPTEDACRCISRLTESGLLCPHDMKFRHPLLAGLLYQDIPCAERAELHRLAARRMRHRGDPSEDVAAHLLRSHRMDEPWMAQLLMEVAQGVVEHDPAGARRLIEKAVLHGVPEGHEDRAEALRIQALSGLDLPAAARALTAHTSTVTAPAERFRHALRLSDLRLRLDDTAGALEILEEARRETAGTLDPAAAAHLREAMAQIRFHDGGTHGDAGHHSHHPRHGGHPGEEDRLLRVLLLRTATGDSAAAARRIADRLLSVPRAPYGSARWYQALLAQLWAGDVEEARRHIDTEVGLARADGSTTRIAEALAVRGLVHLHRGQLVPAEDDAREALGLLDRIRAGRFHVGPLARSVLIDVALERDDITAAGALLDEAPPMPGDRPVTWWRLHLLHSAGRALGRLGEARRGLVLLAHCEEELARRGIVNPAILPWRSTRAALQLARRNVTAARRAAQDETTLAHRWGAPFALGRALVAEAAASSGREALRLADRAVELLEPTPAPLLFAHALYAAGRAHRQSGTPRRSRELLHRANEVGISLGADGLVEAVQRELRDAGGRPDPRKDSTESLLTPTERQVSELAARGLSNRDIARLLQVSLRNVESHLTHSYRKLRISGRHELARFFPAEEPPDPAPVLLYQHRTALTPTANP
ncbi:BREX system ATP-binding domain-containing protein [Streptomyces sp. NBC_00691]|uniref:BREX system ATP-binding domain-containing protein n=1 Tax=Streptomyces sp. NBC_00691 TaxID=2903671 RepID=UPI002E37AA0E|nr:BREX system ATP-binding domain-containing protein [Streptomyces sp. NBC_00691]